MALKAVCWVSHAGKLYAPGDDVSHLPEYAKASMLEHGEASDTAAPVKAAVDAELVRKEQVRIQQQARSRKREHNEKAAAGV